MESKTFKDRWKRASARALADQVGRGAPGFDRARFVRRGTQGLTGLEMKDRVRPFAGALRAPIKAGHDGAIAPFGFESADNIEVTLSAQDPSMSIGETGTFDAEIRTSRPGKKAQGRPCQIMVELVIEFVKANGSRSGKVFKWAEREMPGSGTVRLTKSLLFAPRSTRRLYPGEHRAAVQVNGRRLGHICFDLHAP